MNKEDALLIYRDCIDVEECWEEKLMEHLNFFRSKAIVPTVFRSRLERLMREAEAAEVLLKETFTEVCGEVQIPEFGGTIRSGFDAYFGGINNLTAELFRSPYPINISFQVNEIIDFSGNFCRFVHDALKWKVEDVKVSVLPDPMLIYRSIESYEMKGIIHFNDLKSDASDDLVAELKRMIYLFNTYYKDV